MWARIENGIVAELTEENPEGRFHPSIEWVTATKSAKVGHAYRDGKFTAPAVEHVIPVAISNRRAEVDALRNVKIGAGMAFEFPDGQVGTIQLRDERDLLNVNAVAAGGTALVVGGDSETMVAFRDAEDVTHTLTGAQATEFGLAVMKWVSDHYATAWAHKDSLQTLADAGDLAGLEAYDITQGWPA